MSRMIRSCRIPSVLRRICTDNVIQTALLVTTDGELLGSTATTFLSPDGTTKESIESLGTLIADIAVDYSRLGEEYANLDPVPITPVNAPNAAAQQASGASTGGASAATASSSSGVSVQSSSSSPSNKKSHLQCLLLELELGLVAVSTCVGVDCMVIAIAAPSAPLGSVKARLQAITAHVQEALSPLATEANTTSYR
mmetsp:Transcript_355/g.920  ORF Transcript_355/g.920 Transcript_355/m.920 type:complete len:197 (-) Transcript_355:2722-3312(-)|eukprot:CAMPEP_0168203594 /NCGR_PEP_ID=MMETSP0139_2-20121125/24939_1 /TAXON_ID=44445 /ORGANISM="Pseudo-nitzschia australis, Strain 10249 10 AB" /LENGTH=196 /DNA_ID=CAMNT_0008129459 /DNA_START=193 /DNA_END=783 /DNA_ORIENTATION=+